MRLGHAYSVLEVCNLMTLAELKALPTAEMQLESMRQLLAEKTELITELTEERNQALRVRDLAREASNRDLEAKRQAEAKLKTLLLLASAVGGYDWSTSTTEAYHVQRVGAMAQMRKWLFEEGR